MRLQQNIQNLNWFMLYNCIIANVANVVLECIRALGGSVGIHLQSLLLLFGEKQNKKGIKGFVKNSSPSVCSGPDYDT